MRANRTTNVREGRVMEGWKEREVKVIARQNRSTKPSEQRRY